MGMDIKQKLGFFTKSFNHVLDRSTNFVKVNNLFHNLEKQEDQAFKNVKKWLSGCIESYLKKVQNSDQNPPLTLDSQFFADMKTDLEGFLAHKQYKGNSITDNDIKRNYTSIYTYRPESKCNFFRYLAQENRKLDDPEVQKVRTDFDILTKHSNPINKSRGYSNEENSTESIKFLLSAGVDQINKSSSDKLGVKAINVTTSSKKKDDDSSLTASTVDSHSELSAHEKIDSYESAFGFSNNENSIRANSVILPSGQEEKSELEVKPVNRKSFDDSADMKGVVDIEQLINARLPDEAPTESQVEIPAEVKNAATITEVKPNLTVEPQPIENSKKSLINQPVVENTIPDLGVKSSKENIIHIRENQTKIAEQNKVIREEKKPTKQQTMVKKDGVFASLFKSKKERADDKADALLIEELERCKLYMDSNDRKQMLYNIEKDMSGSFQKDIKLRNIHEKLNKSLEEHNERFEYLNRNWLSDQKLLEFLSHKYKINLLHTEFIEEGGEILETEVKIKDLYSFLLYAMQTNDKFHLKDCFTEIERQLNNRELPKEITIKKASHVLQEVVMAENIPLKDVPLNNQKERIQDQPQIIKQSNRTIVQKEIAAVVEKLGKPNILAPKLVEQEIKTGKNVLNNIILSDNSKIRSALLNSIESSIMNEARTNKTLSKEKKYELARLVHIGRFFKNSADAYSRAHAMKIYSYLLNYMDSKDIMFEDEMKNILIDAFVFSGELDPVVAEHIKLKPEHFYFEAGSLKSEDTPGGLNGRYNKCIFWTFAYARAVSGEIKKQETEKKSHKDLIVENLDSELGIMEKQVIDVKSKQIDQVIEDMMKEEEAKIDEAEIYDKSEFSQSISEKLQKAIDKIMQEKDPAKMNRDNKNKSEKLDKDIFTHWVLSVYKKSNQLIPKDKIATAIYNWLIKNTKMIYVDEEVKSKTIESYPQFLKILKTPKKKIGIKAK